MSHLSFALLLLLASGCSLFDTRDPEEPAGSRSTWETPRVPQDVLVNLRLAVFERNGVNYLRSFNSTLFEFEADQVTLARAPEMVLWGYAEESAHVQRLFTETTIPRDSLLSVSFLSPVETIIGDSAEIRVQYSLVAGVALEGVPRRMSGTADFYLSMGEQGYWEIYRWRDNRTGEESTWSDLKSLVR